MVDYDELMYTTGESEDGYNSYDGYDGYDYGYDFFRRRYYDSNENEEDEEEEEKEDTHAKTLLEQFNSDSEDSYTEEELLVYAKSKALSKYIKM
jgi:hypothetical protein